ncbi:MAG: CU044_2847 family protein [Chloroflexota bacterium]
MATYIEYQLEDGATILIETEEHKTGGVTKASRDTAGNVITSANQKFEAAFAGVKKSALVLRHQLEEMRADEVEVTFGLKATGDLGNFAIGKVGAEANYTVKLKWSNRADT